MTATRPILALRLRPMAFPLSTRLPRAEDHTFLVCDKFLQIDSRRPDQPDSEENPRIGKAAPGGTRGHTIQQPFPVAPGEWDQGHGLGEIFSSLTITFQL